jgi:hypothetical protein
VTVSTWHDFTTPYAGSLPKNELTHCPPPVTLFSIQLEPAPYRTVFVPLNWK